MIEIHATRVHIMDQYDEAQIDLAHRERRRAYKLLKALHFEEAIAAHEEATSCLEKARSLSNDSVVQESLLLQIAFHARQKQVVRYKQELQRNQHKRHTSISYSRTTADTVELAEMALPDGTSTIKISAQTRLEDLQEIIAKQLHTIIDRNDELLLQMYRKTLGETGSASSITSITTIQEQGQWLEELRANNAEIRRLFEIMAEGGDRIQQRNKQLEREVEILREKLRSLEKVSSSSTEGNVEQSLPDLAPLEIPTFENLSNMATSLFS
ncbi:nuclear receptor-binding factor 2-like [Tropilaelaps mercedesae]|uniref:Nuclear receptor-binding factor 2-like n=1 Tax=Tropilaelaps mercedesae TaxID=418985 RepID=A0A1V9Y0T9_9ACAR|nr:nuclear receptor-binding factor 2-like [Tropilaelaps mercedesae]